MSCDLLFRRRAEDRLLSKPDKKCACGSESLKTKRATGLASEARKDQNNMVEVTTNSSEAVNVAQEFSSGNHAASNGYPDVATPAIVKRELSAQHRDQLAEESAVSDEAIETRGYWTETDRENLMRLGFSAKQSLVPALVIPLHNYRGDVAGHVLRADIPRNGAVNGKPIKYETPQGTSPILDIAPLTHDQIDDPTKPLIITEGAKKADSAASRGLCAINLNGVYGFRGTNAKGGMIALPDWENIAIKGRVIYVVFDSDVVTKPQVESALRRLCPFLQSRGAIAKVVYLPDAANGKKQVKGIELVKLFAGTIKPKIGPP